MPAAGSEAGHELDIAEGLEGAKKQVSEGGATIDVPIEAECFEVLPAHISRYPTLFSIRCRGSGSFSR